MANTRNSNAYDFYNEDEINNILGDILAGNGAATAVQDPQPQPVEPIPDYIKEYAEQPTGQAPATYYPPEQFIETVTAPLRPQTRQVYTPIAKTPGSGAKFGALFPLFLGLSMWYAGAFTSVISLWEIVSAFGIDKFFNGLFNTHDWTAKHGYAGMSLWLIPAAMTVYEVYYQPPMPVEFNGLLPRLNFTAFLNEFKFRAVLAWIWVIVAGFDIGSTYKGAIDFFDRLPVVPIWGFDFHVGKSGPYVPGLEHLGLLIPLLFPVAFYASWFVALKTEIIIRQFLAELGLLQAITRLIPAKLRPRMAY